MESIGVTKLLDQAIQVLKLNDSTRVRYSSDIRLLENRKVVANANTFRIGVIGVTSSGKSTLINSLLGEDLLPSRVKPSSSQLVKCHHSNKREAYIYFEKGPSLTIKGNDLSQEGISIYADENLNSGNKESVREIEILSPAFPFSDDILLVDSPGLDAFGYESHEKLTMASLLPTIDMCILVTTCKTNSDLKLCSVLNAIAESTTTDIPVIIIQNMIDSIMPSPDGTKSKDDVAKDHRRRLQRVVDSSKIRNKSLVRIVQFSALWARDGRLLHNKALLECSNFNKLIESVESALSFIKPRVNTNRILRAKREIKRISDEAYQDAGGKDAIFAQESFEFSDFEKSLNDFIEKKSKEFRKVISTIDKLLSDSEEEQFFTQSDVSNAIKGVSSIENVLISSIKSTDVLLEEQCNRLNIEKRDLFAPIQINHSSNPHLHKTTTYERVKEKGFHAFLKRHNPFRDADAGYKTISHTEIDNEATREDVFYYLSSSKRVFLDVIKKQERRTSEIKKQLLNEVDCRRKSFEERSRQILEAQQYLAIASGLESLIAGIEVEEVQTNTNNEPFDKPSECLSNLNVPYSSFALYSIARVLKNKIHNELYMRLHHRSSVVVIGWDEISESRFIRQYEDLYIEPNSIRIGKNSISNKIYLFHSVDEGIFLDFKNITIFVLVNATQIGAAEKQLNKLFDGCVDIRKADLNFVVQDFEEVINANDVQGTLAELDSFIKEVLGLGNSNILVVHENPIYNLAAITTQQSGAKLQTDEVEIVNDLKSCFGFLFEDCSPVIIHDIFNALSLCYGKK